MSNVNADFFIIPNTVSTLGEHLFPEGIRKRLAEGGIGDVKDEEKLIQVWITGGGSDNWADHGDPIAHKYFTSFLPLSMVRDLKEGDVIKLTLPSGDVVQLAAKQLDYRYRSFGKFEEVLARLVA